MRNRSMRTKTRHLKLRRLLRRPRRRATRSHRRPRLRFSPTAWAKLLFLRDRGSTEVGGFGVTPADDLLCINDIRLVRQNCTAVSVAFDDTAVAEFFDDQVDAGHRPAQFARVWIHTHPGEAAQPSQVDEETFRRVFGACDWAVMFILARGGETYCRLRFRAGPGGSFEIPVQVDFEREFAGSDFQAWSQEYGMAVRPGRYRVPDASAIGLLADEAAAVPTPEFLDDLWGSFDQREETLIDERPL